MHDISIRKAQPGDILHDDEVKGLQLRVFDSRKSFYLYFRTKLKKERRPKLGDYPTISLAKARSLARAMLNDVADGMDPVVERERQRQAPTVSELWTTWLTEEGNIKSVDEYTRVWNKYLAPKLAAKRVADVQYADLKSIHTKMKATPYMANRAIAIASTLFSLAEKHGYRPRNSSPTSDIERYAEPRRKRHMAGDEPIRIAEILRREGDRNPASVAFLYLLILTGARKSEIAKAKWPQVIGNKIVLTVHKTDGKGEVRTIYLAPQAVDILAKLPKDDEKTITGIQSPKKLWERIRIEAGCPDLRMHDLRRSFASVALKAGLSLDQIGEMLGHSSTQTTKGYAWMIEEAGHASAAATADAMGRFMNMATSPAPSQTCADQPGPASPSPVP